MRRIYILYIATISILSLIYINNTSALDYSSNVGIGFTFNPTLSVSISPSDLIIDNLIPGSTLDSNSINVSVATNAAYGYTLSANVGDSLHNNTNLTHTNNTSVFSSIATNADLASLDTDNTWGYTSKLSNETIWNNYNGLSSSSNTILLDNSNAADSTGSVDFKISAKASSTQPSGEYTGTINFIAITKPTPMNLAESYFAHGKTRYNGYYTMQDMTTEICNDTEIIGEGSQTELIDIRDNKVYWATKLADNHCWMTQNLDLDLDSNRTYTHWDTDLGWSTENSNTADEDATWKPSHSTIDFDGANTNQVLGWVNSNTEPYSANPGDIYYYTSGTGESDIKYNSLQECIIAGHNDCAHYHAGNYYNWSAAVANANQHSMTNLEDLISSICPSNWTLPSRFKNDFGILFYKQGVIESESAGIYTENGFRNIRTNPLYFTRCGSAGSNLSYSTERGEYWTKTYDRGNLSFYLSIRNNNTGPINNYWLQSGLSVRCLAR